MIDAHATAADLREVRSVQFRHVMAAWASGLARIEFLPFAFLSYGNCQISTAICVYEGEW
ncbi:MAG TPA: hypothetical protein VKM55_02310 [Candidatus Lokiarchaeia archaeon]|nr:hypothetical protein [Candidatus Lokiarchaeia archaeon]